MKHHLEGSLKIMMLSSVLSPAFCITIFSVLLTFSNTRDKRGDKLLSGPDRLVFVIATIICSSFPPLFLAP